MLALKKKEISKFDIKLLYHFLNKKNSNFNINCALIGMLDTMTAFDNATSVSDVASAKLSKKEVTFTRWYDKDTDFPETETPGILTYLLRK